MALGPGGEAVVLNPKTGQVSYVPLPGQTPGAATPINLNTATLAQLQQYANQQAAAQTAAATAPLSAQQQATDQQYANHGLAIQGFSQALAQLLGQLAPKVQDAYTQAANSQATFGKGFSDAIQNQIGNSSQANANFLQQMGAPAGAARPTPDVGSVAYGLGGYIPASTMNREGAAFGAAANLLPGDALLRGQQDFTSNLNEQNAADAKIQQQIADIFGKQPGLALDALAKLSTMQSQARSTALAKQRLSLAGQKVNPTLSASMGVLVNDQGQILPGKGGKPIPYTPYEKPGKPQFITGADGAKYQVGSDGTLTQVLPGKPTSGPGSSTHLQSKNVNGHYVTFDPTTGTYFIPGTNTPVDPNSFRKQAKVSTTTMRQARQMAGGFFKGPDGSTISLSGISSLLSQYNTANKKHYTVSQVISNPEALAVLGVTKVSDPQEIYVALAHMGVPAQTAFDIVAGRNKKWGTAARRARYFPGKGSAAQNTAYSPQTGDVDQALISLRNSGEFGDGKTPQSAKQIAFRAAGSTYGWGPQELAALDQLWTNESGWNYTAHNPSGATGIPQALGHNLPANFANDPIMQIGWGLNYIKQRYGTPSNALRFWYSQKPPNMPQGHWY